VGGAQTQAPPLHTLPPVHAIPQPPQFCGSLDGSTQAPAQSMVPTGQLITQTPPLHTAPAGQTAGQLPQWSGSVWRSTQTPPQTDMPTGHCAGSLLVSTQARLHGVSAREHDMLHCPTSQTCPAAQATPQAPQLCGSLPRSVHISAQRASPAPQSPPPPPAPAPLSSERSICA